MFERADNIKEEVLSSVPHIGVVYAGGTISSLKTEQGYREGGHTRNLMEMLQEHDPEFISGRFTLGEPVIVFTGLSENMTLNHRNRIKNTLVQMIDSGGYQSIVLTHGTDSLEQTVKDINEDKEIKEKLQIKGMKIIVTGAEYDKDDPNTDVWDNLKGALNTAIDERLEPGVFVSFHRRIIPAARVIKRPYAGVQTTFDFLDKESEEFREAWRVAQKRMFDLEFEVQYFLEKNYDWDRLSTGETRTYVVSTDRDDHSSILGPESSNLPLRAIILELYHSGTANTIESELSITNLIQQIRNKWPYVVIFATTENLEPVNLHAYETSVKLRQSGVVPLYDMPKSAARIKIDWAITQTHEPTTLIDLVLANLVGEIDESMIFREDIKELKALYRTIP